MKTKPVPQRPFRPSVLLTLLLSVTPATAFPPTNGFVQFSAAGYSAVENVTGGVVSVTVFRSGLLTNVATVTCSAVAGSATPGADFVAVTNTLTFGTNETSKLFNVTILDDALTESNETVNLILSNPVGATLLNQSNAVLTIQDNDFGCPPIILSPPDLTIGTVGVPYFQTLTAGGGTPPYIFTVADGALPSALTLASDGTLSGTPTMAGNFTFTALATATGGCVGTQAYTVTISGGPAQADLRVTKTANTNSATVGELVDFRIEVSNLGPAPSTGVQVRDVLPAGFGFVSASRPEYDSGTGIWNLGSLGDPGFTEILLITAQATTAGSHVNTAQVIAADHSDPNATNNSASVVVTVSAAPSEADLALTKEIVLNPGTLPPEPGGDAGTNIVAVVTGGELAYVLTVNNHGPLAATGVTVSDFLPFSLVVASLQSSQGACTNNSGFVACDLGSLPAGAYATVTIIAQTTAEGFLYNSAYVSATQPDPNPTNNSATAICQVLTPPEIFTQPQSQTVDEGTTVMFSVQAAGSPPLSYQWRFNGDDLPGETSDTLTLIGMTAAQTGFYSVIARNAVGETLSELAALLVRQKFTITASAGPNGSITPNGMIVKYRGEDQSFTATPALNYEVDAWYLDGVPVLSGNSFKLVNLQASHLVSVTFRPAAPCQGIAINFVDLTGGADDTLPTYAIAGAVPQAGWVNALGPSGTLALADGASVTWSAQGTASLPTPAAPADFALMQGYLDSIAGSTTLVTVSGVSFANYDVYVYCAGAHTMPPETRVGRYTLNGTTAKFARDDPTLADFDGTYVEANSATGGAGADAGNHVVFRNVTGASFTIAAVGDFTSGVALSAPVSAVQVVPRGVLPAALLRLRAALGPLGQVAFSLDGASNQPVTIEVSADLVTWTAVATLVNTNGAVLFYDAPSFPKLFYRANQPLFPNGQSLMAYAGAASVVGSAATLQVSGGLANLQFAWASTDPMFGAVNAGGALAMTNVTYVPGSANCPARLVFTATGGGANFSGYMFLDPYRQVVIDVVKTVTNTLQRIRYYLDGLQVDLTLYKSDGRTSLPEAKEVSQGGFLPVNNDDDNRNAKKDKSDNAGENGENDLLRLEMALPLPASLQDKGVMALRKVNAGTTQNSARLKIWKDPQKGATNLVLDFHQPEKTWNLAVPAQRDEFNALRTNLWVEGLAASAAQRDTQLELDYREITNGIDLAWDIIRLTVVELQTHASNGLDAQNRIFTTFNTTASRGEAPPVTLATRLAPPGLPAELLVRWYAHDYDDPSSHEFVDPNDRFAKEPRLAGELDRFLPPLVGGRRANWRDNSGALTAAAMFEQKDAFAISGGVTPYSRKETVPAAIGGALRPVTEYTWREAETRTGMDRNQVSKVVFNATNNRGDNFLVHAGFDFDGFTFLSHLQQDITAGEKALTVWTRQTAIVYAMNRNAAFDDKRRVVVAPGANGVIEPGYDARDQITGGETDARKARVVVGIGQAELFSRPRGNDRLGGRIEATNAATGLQLATINAMDAQDVLRGMIVEGPDSKLEKTTVTSGMANDDHSQLRIEKGVNGQLDTPRHANDALDASGNIVAGNDRILDSAANLAPDDVIRGVILEGADGKLDSRPADANDLVLGFIDNGADGVLQSRPVPDTDADRKDRIVGYLDGGNPDGPMQGDPDDTCLDIKPGYLNDSPAPAAAGDDEYVWLGSTPVIRAAANFRADTTAIAGDLDVAAAAGNGVFYPLEGGEAFPNRFSAIKGAYADALGATNPPDHAIYIELNIGDAVGKASLGSDFSTSEPYALADGQTLKLKINGGAEVTVEFKAAQFMAPANIAMATAQQIADIINGTAGVPAGTGRSVDIGVGGVTKQLALRANTSVEVTGGTARIALGLPANEVVTARTTRYIPNIRDRAVAGRKAIEFEQYYAVQTDYHGVDTKNPANPNDSVQIVGVDKQDGYLGATDRPPHSLAAVGELEVIPAGTLNGNAIHEIGHSWMNKVLPDGGLDFHHDKNNLNGFALAPSGRRYPVNPSCVWAQGETLPDFVDPRHVRFIRNNFTRVWSGATAPLGNDDYGADDD